jgi:hypothetical protein
VASAIVEPDSRTDDPILHGARDEHLSPTTSMAANATVAVRVHRRIPPPCALAGAYERRPTAATGDLRHRFHFGDRRPCRRSCDVGEQLREDSVGRR